MRLMFSSLMYRSNFDFKITLAAIAFLNLGSIFFFSKKDFVFENVSDLKNVYLAGGEPMLMKENYEFLKLLKVKNPNCNIRVNTNLSTTGTGIFELLCTFDWQF